MRRPDPLFGDEPAQRNGLALRRMTSADLEAVMEIERRAFSHPWSSDLVRRELGHEWSTVLVAVDGRAVPEQLLGLLIFWRVHDEIHILNVAVDPPYRRRGVARTLLEETLERGRVAGASLATLEVRKTNTAAVALYEALGFRTVGVRPRYYVDEGEDAIVMVLDL